MNRSGRRYITDLSSVFTRRQNLLEVHLEDHVRPFWQYSCTIGSPFGRPCLIGSPCGCSWEVHSYKIARCFSRDGPCPMSFRGMLPQYQWMHTRRYLSTMNKGPLIWHISKKLDSAISEASSQLCMFLFGLHLEMISYWQCPGSVKLHRTFALPERREKVEFLGKTCRSCSRLEDVGSLYHLSMRTVTPHLLGEFFRIWHVQTSRTTIAHMLANHVFLPQLSGLIWLILGRITTLNHGQWPLPTSVDHWPPVLTTLNILKPSWMATIWMVSLPVGGHFCPCKEPVLQGNWYRLVVT